MAKPPKESKLGDNSEKREAQLLVHMDNIRTAQAEVDSAQDVVRARKKIVQQHRTAAKADGFKLGVLDEALKKESQSRVDQQAEENERRFVFSMLGLPIGQDAGDLESAAARDEKFWGNHGYSTGVKGLPAELPPGMPAEFNQHWLLRHAAGWDRLKWAQAEQQGNSPEHAAGAEVRNMTRETADA